MTSIWSANLILGSDSNQVILERRAIKRLPTTLLMSDSHFIKGLMLKIGEKPWNKLPKDKTTGLPMLKVFYLKHLGYTAQEPEI